MRFAIMGAGGIGGFYGGALAHAGEDVTFIARGAHLDALRRDGLRVQSVVLGNFHLPHVQATDEPASVGPVDTVILATKAYDLEAAAEAMRPLVGADTAVVPLLNGVDIAERIGAVVGAERVLIGFCHVSSAVAAPGVIRQQSSFERIVVGERSGEATPRARAVADALTRAGANAECAADAVAAMWEKYVYICAAGGVCALTGATLGPVVSDPDTRALFRGVMEEIAALAVARGVALPEGTVERLLARADAAAPEVKPSMLLDLERGNRLEVAALNGTAARLGREHGVATPVNAFIHAALKLRAAGAP